VLKDLKTRLFGDSYSTPSMIRRLLAEHALSHWRAYLFVLFMMAIMAASTASAAYLIGHAVNAAYVSRNFGAVLTVCMAIIIIAAIRGFATYFQAVELSRISNRITADNQRRIFEKLMQQGLAFFADRHSSEFSARITSSARSASSTINILITTFGRDLFSLLGLLAVMVSQSAVLSLLSFVVMPIAAYVARGAINRVRSIVRAQFGAGSDILEILQETVQGFKIIEAFNLHLVMTRRLNSGVETVEGFANKLARAMNFTNPLMESLGGVAIALVILAGGYQTIVLNGEPGEYFSFITAFLLAYEPAKRLTRVNVELSNTLTGVRILFEFLDLPERRDDEGMPDILITKGAVELQNVQFGYRPNAPVLNRISLLAQPGSITALVGPSGGGKSTIINLILRFYDNYSGSILIDGTEIGAVSRKLLRDHFAFVGQDAFLFRGTVRDNIALGRSDATDADVIDAARAAHADEFINQLPSGYQTQVGEQGMQLSGGQRQRISVARALIRKASIILLDEPTSFLDTETERYVNLAISRLFSGRTRIVIAHRLNTIVNADMIHVIENGRVVESGRHRDLLDRGERYAHFFNLQISEKSGSPA
jgi:ABC-type multidrug transport system fused ATPase/permease subunit